VVSGVSFLAWSGVGTLYYIRRTKGLASASVRVVPEIDYKALTGEGTRKSEALNVLWGEILRVV
jgi:hypothetical protein